MPSNNRIFYAVHLPGFSKLGLNTFTPVHGVQSVTINTTFNLEQVFELGQISLYENIENIPEVEVTIEKVLDGYPCIYLLATNGASAATLAGRSTVRSTMALSIYDDSQSSASGTPKAQVTCSGLYVNTIGYTFPVDGNCTEQIGFVGNNKIWSTGELAFTFTPSFVNTDEPLAISGSGGVQRRENVKMGSGGSKWPTHIPGITSSGTNETSGDTFDAHIQTVRVTCNLGRTDLFELGRRRPYHKYANFPAEVRTEIEITSTLGDNIDALEANDSNVTNSEIIIKTDDGLTVDLGTKNKLTTVSYTGGNAQANGGNVTNQYSYSNFNDLTVSMPNDPTTALRQ